MKDDDHDNNGCAVEPRMRDTVRKGDDRENTYYVEFDDRNGDCYGIIMQGGECWGRHGGNGNGKWNCNGRCGPGCGSWTCSNWARTCLKHDACGWYMEATGGSKNEDCKDEYNQAVIDTMDPCSYYISPWQVGRGQCEGDASSC